MSELLTRRLPKLIEQCQNLQELVDAKRGRTHVITLFDVLIRAYQLGAAQREAQVRAEEREKVAGLMLSDDVLEAACVAFTERLRLPGIVTFGDQMRAALNAVLEATYNDNR